MILSIGRGVFCYNLTTPIREKIRKDLTFKNPVYEEAKEKGRYISLDTHPHIYFYVFDKEDDVYWIPRGYLYFLKRWLNQQGIEVKIRDKTLLHKPLNLKFLGELREYQDLAVNDMVRRYPVGVLEASTGSGKTVMGLAIIAQRQQRTLILVHNKELLYQWQAQIKKFIGVDCGILGDGKFNIQDITVGIVNTVRNNVERLSKQFGQVVCDECHRVASTTWTDIMQEFPAKFYLGLSATPYRRDGLGMAINAFIGPKLHTVDKDMLHEIGAVLKPTIFRIETSFRYLYKNDYSTMVSRLADNDARNELIARAIQHDLNVNDDNVLVVSDRVTHCRNIADELELKGISSLILHGKVKQKERNTIVEEVRAGRCKVLISTLSLIGEGFDAPNLSSLFLTTPVKFSGRLLQVIGRILRPEEGKEPRVFDFRDNGVCVLRNQGFTRDRIYKKQWK